MTLRKRSESVPATDHAIAFGPFRLFAMQHLLLEAEEPVRLGHRALEILITLVERCGEVVSNEELIARVWPNTFVEDGNLKVHVSSLRKALGDGVAGNSDIIHIPRRGYQFVASVTRSENPSSIGRAPSIGHSPQLPAPVTRMIGRAATVDAISAQLPQSRFLTIAGPGGSGKTSVALAGVQELLGAT